MALKRRHIFQLVDSPCKSEGSSSPASEADEDAEAASTDLLGNNNKGEENEKQNGDQSKLASAMDLIGDQKDTPPSIRVEDIKVENDTHDDGRIDLNYYLQQAIQSASMPCPLCKKV